VLGIPVLERPMRSSARVEARLDAETHAKLQALAATFHRTRAAVLRVVMQWGPKLATTSWVIVAFGEQGQCRAQFPATAN
jgi:hypothetical protein